LSGQPAGNPDNHGRQTLPTSTERSQAVRIGLLRGLVLTVATANHDELSEYGGAPTHTLRADEALPAGAISQDAAVVRTDERIEPADGVAAVLRYAP
jgi:hypothetical protein